ncbi:4226_t:CDS:2 [Scutellospora calospora]|uniref:4226_t:CDS:1 n=1 Tax=Scutellospora calospora TaxID=85575 RepID=A0ACA9K2C4_9GLOM|nr:4226_t:CDS:2 [Scutellospora calospora]
MEFKLNTVNFSLLLGWILKEKQKYRKKRAGKRITKKIRKILERYFLTSNADKSDHYTTQNMYQALQQKVLKSDIEAETVLKLFTIQS